MSELELWQKRFSTTEYAFGEEPNVFLSSCKDLFPQSGKALAVADGEGRNGVFLARHGLDTLSIDFSPNGQTKAQALANKHGIRLRTELCDVHSWDWPEDQFDVIAEIFTQFSPPGERAIKWHGMKKSLKKGGLLLIEGYTPKQLQYTSGGPKQLDKLYTRELLESEFASFSKLVIKEYDTEKSGGHSGIAAVIDMIGWK